jgi:hypothetical protein
MLITLQIPQHIPYSDRTVNNGNGGVRAPTFGVPLGDQMARDQVEVPKIVVKCCDVIERYGLELQGIYRIPGTMTKVQELKRRADLSECFYLLCRHFKGLTHNDA